MYDELAALYDLFIDWPNRLQNELPLLERLGAGVPGHHLVDVACGTGRHALAWAERGCRVTGCDASAEMIGRARGADTERRVEWRVATMTDLPQGLLADTLVCIGTSLPHVAEPEEYRTALREFARCTRPDGQVVVHSRNLPRILATGDRFTEPLVRQTPEGTVLFWRFYDLLPPHHIDFHLVIFRQQESGWTRTMLTSRLCVISAEELCALAREVGFTDARCCGHLDEREYDRNTSPDLVLIAKR